jgi:hypothetical protein
MDQKNHLQMYTLEKERNEHILYTCTFFECVHSFWIYTHEQH